MNFLALVANPVVSRSPCLRAAAALVTAATLLGLNGQILMQAVCFAIAFALTVSDVTLLARKLTVARAFCRFPRTAVLGLGAYPLIATLAVFMVQ